MGRAGRQDTTPETRNAPWPMSLLWPSTGADRASKPLNPAVVSDLALDRIVRALDAAGRHDRIIRAILCDLPADPAVIHYRQEILADLLHMPALAAALQEMLPALATLANPGGPNWPGESPLLPVIARLRELDHYVTCVDRLSSILDGASGIRSAGLLQLRAGIAALAESPDVVALRAELPALHELIGEASSVTIGLNLGRDLEPESATIVELNRFQFKGPRSLVGRLLPGAANGGPSGRTPLHQVGPSAIRRDSQLYRDLQRLLEAVTAPLVKELARYRDIHAGPLAALERELAFFTGAAALITRLQGAGIAVCRPEIAPAAERAFVVVKAANVALALQMMDDRDGSALDGRLVANDARFDSGTRLFIVTGPNRGGKTTFCRAIGQAQVLFQSGLYVPGTSARISPVDGIWTHFPLPETDRQGAGRLDEEVQRLRQIFAEATGASLVLLNEPLTSTSERDALRIATDMVRALQLLGARGVLVTHLHDLALSIPELNDNAPSGSIIRSLVAEATVHGDNVRGTFRIVPGVPAGHSYASEIARQHGLTFEQLQQLLNERMKDEG